MIKKILIVFIVAFVIIQFFRPKKNIAAGEQPNHISKLYNVPDSVKTIFTKACNDCHSNNTNYPWYNNIQPVAWWLNKHVIDGKRHFNVDEFSTYSIAKQYKKMKECIDELKEGEMPLTSYTLIHRDAILNNAEKQTLINWCTSIRDSLKAKYPADSLVMPKRK
ncbi:MAG: heme-binding domain-containing protein [Bacteroidetes bacterium]|nr:heme-binding domain-containing protein [Bacteroidota bacterium]MBS1648393.1 heme-binding domain-containing protein [Bacteroidota bacterium]